jgi:hypothetical protein
MKLGRTDRKRALRLATVLFVLMMIQWMLAAHHVPGATQLEIFFGGLYRAFFVFGLGALLYLALEPYARKIWPRSLASWVRLLDGRFRDPVVGRDVLAGVSAATGIALVFAATRFFQLQTAVPGSRPDLPFHPAELLALRGMQESLAELLAIHINIATHVLFLFSALLLLRLIFRKTWLAVMVHATLYFLVYSSAYGPFGWLPILVTIVTWHILFFRFGWISIYVFTVVSDAFNGFPFTIDLSAWQAGASMLVIGFSLALALYAFKVSLGGRRVFQDLLGEG